MFVHWTHGGGQSSLLAWKERHTSKQRETYIQTKRDIRPNNLGHMSKETHTSKQSWGSFVAGIAAGSAVK